MTDIPQRPQWNHPQVKTAAAELVLDDVKAWAIAMSAIPRDADDREVLAALALALIESVDCYEAARYLDSFLDWPVNGELVRVIDRAYLNMERLTKPFVHAWVMENQIRFRAKEGDVVVFRVGPAELQGTCVGAVKREGMGFVDVRGKLFTVVAEDVVKTMPGAKPFNGKNPPPTGGTPIAPRSGAQLTEKKAAVA